MPRRKQLRFHRPAEPHSKTFLPMERREPPEHAVLTERVPLPAHLRDFEPVMTPSEVARALRHKTSRSVLENPKLDPARLAGFSKRTVRYSRDLLAAITLGVPLHGANAMASYFTSFVIGAYGIRPSRQWLTGSELARFLRISSLVSIRAERPTSPLSAHLLPPYARYDRAQVECLMRALVAPSAD